MITEATDVNGFAVNSDSLYELIQNDLAEGIYFTDVDRRIMLWNKGAEKLFLVPRRNALKIQKLST